jgi:hypothetical protein
MYREWQLRQDEDLPQVDVGMSARIQNLAHRMSQAVHDFFNWLFRSRRQPSVGRGSGWEGMGGVLKAVAWMVLAVALVFILVLIVKIVSQSSGGAPSAVVLSRRQVREALEAGDALAMGSAQWLDEARRLAAEQNFRAVYRAMYLALLSGLHSAGKIEHSRNRTNWAYVQQYRGSSDERVTFGELTDLFDHVWYGREEAAAGTDLDQLQRKVATLTGAGA